MNDMNVRVQSFNLDTIAEAWDTELDGILPDLEGSISDKLQTAMNEALLKSPDSTKWTQEQVASWFGLEDLADSNGSAFENIYKELQSAAQAVPQGVKDEILQNYKDSIPTAEEIKEAIDWDSLTNNDLNQIYQDAGAGAIEGGVQQIDMSLEEWATMFGEDYQTAMAENSSRTVLTR